MKWIKTYEAWRNKLLDISDETMQETVTMFNQYFDVVGIKMEPQEYRDNTLPEGNGIEYVAFPVSINYQNQLLFHHIIEEILGYPDIIYPALSLGRAYREASSYGVRATLLNDGKFEIRLYRDHIKPEINNKDYLFNLMARVINGLMMDSPGYYTENNGAPPVLKPFDPILND